MRRGRSSSAARSCASPAIVATARLAWVRGGLALCLLVVARDHRARRSRSSPVLARRPVEHLRRARVLPRLPPARVVDRPRRDPPAAVARRRRHLPRPDPHRLRAAAARAVGLGRRPRRARPARVRPAHALRRAIAWSVGWLTVLWLPVLIDQLFVTGNIGAVTDYVVYTGDTEGRLRPEHRWFAEQLPVPSRRGPGGPRAHRRGVGLRQPVVARVARAPRRARSRVAAVAGAPARDPGPTHVRRARGPHDGERARRDGRRSPATSSRTCSSGAPSPRSSSSSPPAGPSCRGSRRPRARRIAAAAVLAVVLVDLGVPVGPGRRPPHRAPNRRLLRRPGRPRGSPTGPRRRAASSSAASAPRTSASSPTLVNELDRRGVPVRVDRHLDYQYGPQRVMSAGRRRARSGSSPRRAGSAAGCGAAGREGRLLVRPGSGPAPRNSELQRGQLTLLAPAARRRRRVPSRTRSTTS